MAKRNLIIMLLTPVIMFAICGGIIGAAAYIPFTRVKSAANIVFSAETKHEKINEIKYSEIETEAEIIHEDKPVKIIYPSFGMQYATITIKSIDLIDAPVFFGSTEELLHQGVCMAPQSVFIGEKGNVVLDAHCNTHFYSLPDVKEGDEIVLTTSYGTFTYIANEQKKFKEWDDSLIVPTKDDRLTLYTCYGNLLGPTEDRIAVICELKEKKFNS